MIHTAVGLLGAFIVVGTVVSMVKTLVSPRGSSALVVRKDRAITATLRGVARHTSTYATRDRVLTWVAPLSLLSSLVVWLGAYYLGFGLIMWAVSGLPAGEAFREAGSSLATLGYSAHPGRELRALDFAAAATGPITISLLVGYLPTMYAAYQRREAEVTLLVGRANEPAWGPEVLRRHAASSLLGELDGLFDAWERWAADVSESHTNFPVLVHMRSTRPLRNWVVALLSVMDAAAIHLALNPSIHQSPARLMLRQGITCLREVATVERIPFDPDPSPDTPSQVSEEEFAVIVERLVRFGYPVERPIHEAYLNFRGWRANYETLAESLADRIYAVPAPWSGPRTPAAPVIEPARIVDRRPTIES